jgi:hypothetical protein
MYFSFDMLKIGVGSSSHTLKHGVRVNDFLLNCVKKTTFDYRPCKNRVWNHFRLQVQATLQILAVMLGLWARSRIHSVDNIGWVS